MNTHRQRTDDDLAELDIPALLRYGLSAGGARRAALFGEGAVAAAVAVDRLHVVPRSLGYLAEVVRAGGTRYAADLAEPLPGPEPTRLVQEWLDTAATVTAGVDDDEVLARWLDAVAELLAMRRRTA
ncbi:hypothetical protein ACIRPK_07585 [Kitasatospora sp. NPDC101801]|uniref:hypothetical protein n=1 Tax=Kitasatospora sp. NPDC101801 TaxID=3364103 RepID=UPI0037F364CB